MVSVRRDEVEHALIHANSPWRQPEGWSESERSENFAEAKFSSDTPSRKGASNSFHANSPWRQPEGCSEFPHSVRLAMI